MTPTTALKTAAGTMMVGSVCPWATAFGGFASASGLAVHVGWLTLLAGAATLWLTIRPGRFQEHRRRIVTVLGVIAALVCLFVVIGADQTSAGGAIQAGWGAYLTLIASIAAVYTGRRALS